MLTTFQSPCESAPCKNGAVCVPEYEWNSYHCDCKLGYHGMYCGKKGIQMTRHEICLYVYKPF